MYKPGTLILFETVGEDGEESSRFFLKFLEYHASEFKMEGGLPGLWRVKYGKVSGPDIGDGEARFRIVRIDKKRRTIWLTPASH